MTEVRPGQLAKKPRENARLQRSISQGPEPMLPGLKARLHLTRLTRRAACEAWHLLS